MYIYCITNLINGKIYVGQHKSEDLGKYFRKNIRFALRGRTDKPRLYEAIRDHGPEQFTISPIVRPVNEEQMEQLERFFIRVLDSRNSDTGYNVLEGGSSFLGHSQRGRSKSEEHRKKLSASQKGVSRAPRSEEHRRKISENKKKWWKANKATFKRSEESLEKTRQASLGRKMPPRSNEYRQNLSEGAKKRIQLFERNPDGTLRKRRQSSQGS